MILIEKNYINDWLILGLISICRSTHPDKFQGFQNRGWLDKISCFRHCAVAIFPHLLRFLYNLRSVVAIFSCS